MTDSLSNSQQPQQRFGDRAAVMLEDKNSDGWNGTAAASDAATIPSGGVVWGSHLSGAAKQNAHWHPARLMSTRFDRV